MSKTPSPRSLEQYSRDNPTHHSIGCWVASLPSDIRAQIDAARGKLGPTAVLRWLRDEIGIEGATGAKIQRHLKRECSCAK
jgi:hypothetical protein